MGQRLNIELYDRDGNLQANCYMHWSAYTSSTLTILGDIINIIYKYYPDNMDDYPDDMILLTFKKQELQKEKEDPKLWAVRILEKITETSIHTMVPEHPGLSDSDLEYMESHYPNIGTFHRVIDRNIGIISVLESTMESTRTWEEGRLNIYPYDKKFSFDVFNLFESDDEDYMNDLKELLVWRNLSADERRNLSPDDLCDRIANTPIDDILNEIPLVDFDPTDELDFDKYVDVLTTFRNHDIFKFKSSNTGNIIYVMSIE